PQVMQTLKMGTAEHWRARLRRDRPDLAEHVAGGRDRRDHVDHDRAPDQDHLWRDARHGRARHPRAQLEGMQMRANWRDQTATALQIAKMIADYGKEEQLDLESVVAMANAMSNLFEFSDEERDQFVKVALTNFDDEEGQD